MAKLNWNRVGVEAKMWRRGIVPATDVLPIPIASKKRRPQKRAEAYSPPKGSRQETAAPARTLTKKQQKRLAEELRIRKARRAAHEARMAASQRKRQAILAAQTAAEARALVKNRKRSAEEQRVRKARATKAARRTLHNAQMAAVQQKRRERIKPEALLAAQRKADPEYQAKQAAEIAKRLGKRMKAVVVVRKSGPRLSTALTRVTHAAKPSSARNGKST